MTCLSSSTWAPDTAAHLRSGEPCSSAADVHRPSQQLGAAQHLPHEAHAAREHTHKWQIWNANHLQTWSLLPGILCRCYSCSSFLQFFFYCKTEDKEKKKIQHLSIEGIVFSLFQLIITIQILWLPCPLKIQKKIRTYMCLVNGIEFIKQTQTFI